MDFFYCETQICVPTEKQKTVVKTTHWKTEKSSEDNCSVDTGKPVAEFFFVLNGKKKLLAKAIVVFSLENRKV